MSDGKLNGALVEHGAVPAVRRRRWSERKELCAQLVASGKSDDDAAREVGVRGGRKTLWRWRQDDPAFPARIAELQREQAQQHQITIARVLERLDESRQFAKATENASAMVKADELYAKIGGHLIERIDQRVQFDNRSDAELRRSIEAKMRELGLDAKVVDAAA